MKSKYPVIFCLFLFLMLFLSIVAGPSKAEKSDQTTIEVPVVIGLSAKEAKAELVGAGLAVKWVLGKEALAPEQTHHVYQLHPRSGTKVRKATTVYATIYAPNRDKFIAGRKSNIPTEPGPGTSQPPTTSPISSKLGSALIALQQQKGERAEPFRAALTETLDIDLDHPDPLVGIFIQVKGGNIEQLLSKGFGVETQIGNIVTTTVPISRLEELAGLPDVMSIEASNVRELVLDRSIPDIRADKIRRRNPDGTFSGYAGRGVVVGVIDSGIDWKHHDFQTPSGLTRIKFLWDLFDNTFQTSGGRIGTAPPSNKDGTPKRGTVYTEEQINAGLTDIAKGLPPQVFSRDLNGHGTHVAGIAVGVAPEADLVIVNAGGRQGRFSDSDVVDGLGFINDKAVSMGKPWVANLSLGGHSGPHDGATAYERIIDDLVGSGKHGREIVIAAGNDGSRQIHTGPWGFVYELPVLSPGPRNDPTTGAPLVNLGLPGEPDLNGPAPAAGGAATDPGAVVFRANFVIPPAPPNFDGIFVARGNRLIPVVRNGDSAPLTTGGRFGRSFQRPPSINAQGDIAFDGRFNDPATPRLWKWGIFLATGALAPGAPINIRRIAAHGQTAPGFTRASNRTLSFGFDPRGARGPAVNVNVNRAFSLSRVNNRREVAFTAQIQDPTGGLTLAVFLASPADRARLAMAGDVANGTGGGTFAAFQRPVSLNNNGRVAFTTSIRGGNVRQGIFTVERGNPPLPVVLAGSPAPGTQGGTFSRFGDPTINDNGAIVFSAGVAGAGSPAINQGLFLVQPDGTVVRIALTGQRTRIYLPLSTFAEFLGVPALNNDGLIAFHARVANGTVRQGIFLFLPDDQDPRIVPVAMSGRAVPGAGVASLPFSPPTPGTVAGEEFDQFSSPVMNPTNPNGALTFGASLRVPGGGGGPPPPAIDGIFVASLASGRLTPNKPLVIQVFHGLAPAPPPPAPSIAFFDFWVNHQDSFTMTIYGGRPPGAGGPPAPFPLHVPSVAPWFLDRSFTGAVINPTRGNGDIEVRFITARQGHFIITVTPQTIRSDLGRVDGWLYRSNRVAEFIGISDDRTRLVGMPGTAAEAVTVAAHMSKNRYTDSTGTLQQSNSAVGALATFSSPGKTRDARQKPEISAPGMWIAAARSPDVPPAVPIPWPNDPKNVLPDGTHVISEGTSMAAPHVTGAVALMLEKNAGLEADQIKKILMSTARRDSFTDDIPDHARGTIPDPEERIHDIFWGAGKLNILSAINATPVGAFISGLKYNDLNGNGTRDPKEPGLEGWVIFRDLNKDGELNNPVSGSGVCDNHATEPCRKTAKDGSYRFNIVEPGEYRVREVIKPKRKKSLLQPDVERSKALETFKYGWKQTSADPPDYQMDRTAHSVTNADFGNFKLGIIAGRKFNDLNSNGKKDTEEPGLPDWTVFIDDNEDGVLNNTVSDGVCDANATERCTLTDHNGKFAFVLFKGAYLIREVVQPGWRQTTPNPDFVVINRSGQAFNGEVVPGLNFGNVQTQTSATPRQGE